MKITPLDLSKLKVFPLAERHHLTKAEDILIDPDSAPKKPSPENVALVERSAERIRHAQREQAPELAAHNRADDERIGETDGDLPD